MGSVPPAHSLVALQHAGAVPAEDPSWIVVAVGLAGGIALLLFGLDQLTSVLREVAGDRLRALFRRVSANRWLGTIVGMAAIFLGIAAMGTATAPPRDLPEVVDLLAHDSPRPSHRHTARNPEEAGFSHRGGPKPRPG